MPCSQPLLPDAEDHSTAFITITTSLWRGSSRPASAADDVIIHLLKNGADAQLKRNGKRKCSKPLNIL